MERRSNSSSSRRSRTNGNETTTTSTTTSSSSNGTSNSHTTGTGTGMSRLQQDLSSSPHNHHRSADHQAADGENDTQQPSPMLRRLRPAGRAPHVGIVGAGFAGLRCADVLLQHGFRVTILEGRERVGGRLAQARINGHLVDLGPNWIHGTDNNPILDLARATGTRTHGWDGRQKIFDPTGAAVPEPEATRLMELVWATIEEAMAHSNAHHDAIDPDVSLLDFFRERADALFPGPAGAPRRARLLQLAEMWGAFVGSPVERQSLRFFWLEECIDGENLFVADTYAKVLERVAAPALAGADVRLGHVVAKIRAPEGAEQVTVEVEGRGEWSFDGLVVTAPLGWLKRNLHAFEPPLPPRMEEAVRAIGYGCLDKVYISFPTAFWEGGDDNDGDASANNTSTAAPETATGDSSPNVPSTAAPLHPDPSPAAPSSSSHYPGFTHWLRPAYHPTHPHHPQECLNLAALPGPTAHPTLLFYTYGATSEHLRALLASLPPTPHPITPLTHPHQHTLLTHLFTPYLAQLPHFSPSHPSCTPTAFLPTRWTADPLAGFGSYCNFPVGLRNGDEDVRALREPAFGGRLRLAGEHTAPFVALGTVTGAWWAGEGAAWGVVGGYEGVGGGKVGEGEGK